MSKPSFIAMTPRNYKDGEETKTVWTEIGAAWPLRSGDGFNITLNALPIDGKLSLFLPKEKAKAEEKATAD